MTDEEWASMRPKSRRQSGGGVVIFKLRILIVYVRDAIGAWWIDCGKRDLDEVYCCAGNPMECACRGATTRETLEYLLERPTKTL